MRSLETSVESAISFDDVDLTTYFDEVVGVTVNVGDEPKEVVIFVEKFHAPYVLTKPLHHSQQVVKQREDGIEISIQVQLNYELEKEILSFGETMQVLSPEKLKRTIAYRLGKAKGRYDGEPK